MIVTASIAAYNDQKHRALLDRINPAVGVECLAEQLKAARFTLYEVHADGFFLGIFVCNVDRLMDGSSELVIRHAAAVTDPPRPMTSILNRFSTR